MSTVIAQLEALRAAMALGALRVRHGDKEIAYRTYEEMRREEARLMREAGLSGPSHVNPYSSKGL